MAVSAGPWVFTILGCLLCSIWTWYQLRYYARKDTPTTYFAAVFISWWFGILAVVVLLPMDLAAAKYGDQYTNGESAHKLVQFLWRLDYWLTFVWCWMVCPVVMEYWAAGEFTFKGRLKAAVRHNMRFYAYAISILVFVGFFVAISKGFGPSAVAGYLIAAANCYGMLLVVLMIGYGIVDVPRELWVRSNPARQLRYLEFTANSVESSMLDAKCDLEEIIRSVYAFKNKLEQGRSGIITPDLDRNLQVVVAKASNADNSSSSLVSASQSRHGHENQLEIAGISLTNEGLAELHYRLKRAIIIYERAVYQWENLLVRSLELENRVSTSGESDETYQRLTSGSFDGVETQRQTHRFGVFVSSLKRFFSINKSWLGLLRLCAVICVVLSSVLLWCECVSPVNEQFSVYALLLHSAQNAGLVQFYSCISLLYMAVCAYVALFKFKLLKELALYGDGQTDVYCLLYNASYFGRLQFSLGINYLSMLIPEDARNTAFGALVGDMDAVPFLGTSFNNYIPLVIVFLAFCTLVKAFDRVLNKLGIETNTDPRDDVVEHQERIDEGRNLIQRTRTRRIQREARRTRIMQRERGEENKQAPDISVTIT